tara:strand:- start:640 stop:1914 length:1275 start_codon:yes stop_codon:yes gene_type:complete
MLLLRFINNLNKNVLYGSLDQSLRLVYFLGLTLFYSSKSTPAQLGELSLILIIIQFINSISRFSLDSFIIKNIIENYNKKIFFSFFSLRSIMQLIISVIALCLVLLFVDFKLSYEILIYMLFLNYFRIHESYEYYFKSQNNFEIIFLTRFLSVTIVILYLFFSLNIDYLALIFVADALILFVFLSFAYYYFNKESKKREISFKRYFPIIKRDFKKAGILTISFLLYILLSKMDWISIYFIGSDKDLGLYSFFSRLVEPVTAFTSVLAISYFPNLIKVNESIISLNNTVSKYLKQFSKYGMIIMILSLLVFSLIASPLINQYYPLYENGKSVYYILSLNIFLYFISSLRSYYLILIGKSDLILYFTIVTIVIFFPISLLLTKFGGIEGAAFSSVIYNLFYQFLINYFNKDSFAYFRAQLIFSKKL